MPGTKPDIPIGISIIQKIFPNTVITSRKSVWWRSFILLITFVIYTCYHASRKPVSVVKSALHPNCSDLPVPSHINTTNNTEWCSWKPFDTAESNSLFGLLDSAFLFSYAFAMFFSGFIAERVNLRYFLTIGTLMSGVCLYLFGLAKAWNIHNFWYFIGVQFFGGIFQTAGWPGVVTVMGNWYGQEKTGFIFGLWNSHTSVGNILGALVAGHYAEYDWSLSFSVIATAMIALSAIIFLFLVSEPASSCKVGKNTPNDSDDQSEATVSTETEDKSRVEQRPILAGRNANDCHAIGFTDALKIPGVIEFSFSLFFAKLVSYTFLSWLPMYIHSSTDFGTETSANLSTLFDVGGIIGGIIAGAISDYTGMQAFTCGVMLVYSVPTLYIYNLYGNNCLSLNIALLLLTGALVNGPYALITTAVSAKLGMDPVLAENTKALSTVTAIIDGTGSVGAAAGPLFAGFVSTYSNWDNVFFMLMVSDVISLCMLLRLMKNELQNYSRARSHGWTS